MQRTATRSLISLVLVAVAVSAAAARVDLVTVKELQAQPDKWHGRAVVVNGNVSRLNARTSQRGNPYYTFVLSDGLASVNVFSYGVPQIRDSNPAQVEGTFLKIKRVGNYTFQNQVDARRIQLL